jgi:hypothetical protein
MVRVTVAAMRPAIGKKTGRYAAAGGPDVSEADPPPRDLYCGLRTCT